MGKKEIAEKIVGLLVEELDSDQLFEVGWYSATKSDRASLIKRWEGIVLNEISGKSKLAKLQDRVAELEADAERERSYQREQNERNG